MLLLLMSSLIVLHLLPELEIFEYSIDKDSNQLVLIMQGDKKELLEMLGIRTLSGKTAAQRRAPAKAATTREAKKGDSKS